MSELHTAPAQPIVNENSQGRVKGERARFPNPRSGFEYVAEIIRSGMASSVSAPAQLLLIRLADYLGDNQKPPYVVRPHMATLARSMGHKDKRSTRRLIVELEEAKLLERNIRKSGKQGYIASCYVLCTPSDINVLRVGAEVSVGDRTEMSAHKETSETKETKSKDTTPISPKKGKKGVACYDPAIFEAICKECKLDPILNRRGISKLATDLTVANYTADHVRITADTVRRWWVDYEGNVKPYHIREHILESVPEEDHERIFKKK